jgi:hypothetical protein
LENLLTAPFPVSGKAEETRGGAGASRRKEGPGSGCTRRSPPVEGNSGGKPKTSGEPNEIMGELNWGERRKGIKERETREKKPVYPRRQFL